jgi:flagellum-specific peptidoglycan hydrolase FlgJ
MGRQPPAGIIAAARRATAAYPAAPVSISLGQWALESAWGAKTSGPHNYFGMKALVGQPSVSIPTHEVYKGVRVLVNQSFRAFASDDEAFLAHARLLATGAPYAAARAALPDIRAYAMALGGGTPARPRYATDPNYGTSLWAVIRGSSLTQYD